MTGLFSSFLVSFFDWSVISSVLVMGSDFLVMLFNLFLIFTFIGSIMFAATTVGNSAKMEYLLVMPIHPRTIFIEKSIILIFWSSLFWLSLTTPIIYVFALYSPIWYSLVSVPIYVISLVSLSTLGTAVGGLVGLGISRLVAGRRLLREVGYFVFTSLAIVFSALYYYFIYFGDENTFFFEELIGIASSIGLASGSSPGYIHTQIIIDLIVGRGISLPYVFWSAVLVLLSLLMLHVNGLVSERAHYDGWLSVPTRRSSKKKVTIKHGPWDPQPFRIVKFSQTLSVSIWYNITSIRREGRVLAQYLMNPLRFAIFILIPAFTFGEDLGSLSSFILMIVIVPFATSYGIVFAGYELVYEGSNLMNLQLAAANLEEYVRGKVYSALPFTLGVASILAVFVAVLSPTLLIYAPLIVLSAVFITLASGGYAAQQGAAGGDFKAERMVLRQRGSAVRAPVTGFAALKIGIVPMILGFGGMGLLLGASIIYGPLIAYAGLALFALLCWKIERTYSHSAGVTLAQIDAEKYM